MEDFGGLAAHDPHPVHVRDRHHAPQTAIAFLEGDERNPSAALFDLGLENQSDDLAERRVIVT